MMKLGRDIKNGTIIIVNNKKPERKVFVKGIRIACGSQWHHTGTIIKRNGIRKVFEEGTIHGAVWTDLSEYLRLVEDGTLEIAFKNLKGVDTDDYIGEYNDLADRMVGRHFYNLGLIPKIGVRQIIQQASNWANYIGKKNKWDFKYRCNPEKYGFLCSINTAYMANRITGRFPGWKWMAPDDIFNDTENSYFVQP